MNLLIKRALPLIYPLLMSGYLLSQGFVESPLTGNGILIQKWNELEAQSGQRTGFITDTISLGPKGFLDDFSYDGPYPDTALWLDDFVFINRGYPIAPITIGAATFDGLKANGYPYNFMASQTSSAQADYLTSKPIDLNKPASDSLYFSFYYQPQGRGNPPEQSDSLVLEFKTKSQWKHIWSKKGSTLLSSDSSWKQVIIPITDTAYLFKGFQFRFRNFATLCGNLDHWSIDYVYLNKTPNRYTTPFDDVSFVYNPPPLIKTFSSMPWDHFNSSFMKDTIPVLVRDNDVISKNTYFFHTIFDQSGPIFTSALYSDNVGSFSQTGYYTYKAGLPVLAPTTNPSEYTFETVINNSGLYDTLHRKQLFSNYYAYDDGSAETAFGLSGYLGAQMAEQFTSTKTDTLRCIDIYFNPIITNAGLYEIGLKVWADNGGKPGTVLYTSDTLFAPFYNQTGHDQFTRHYLKTPLNLSAGTFYIGFQQNTTQPINIGVDKNSNTQNRIFYKTSTTWNNAPSPGSLMMRPVFGPAATFTGIDKLVSEPNSHIQVYPNPANDRLYIRADISQKINYTLTDIFGRTISENTITVNEPIDISSLSEGVYFIRTMNGLHISTTKFIKVN